MMNESDATIGDASWTPSEVLGDTQSHEELFSVDATTLFRLGPMSPETVVNDSGLSSSAIADPLTALDIARSVLRDPLAVKRVFLNNPDMPAASVLNFVAKETPTKEEKDAGMTDGLRVRIHGSNVVKHPESFDTFTVPISPGRPVVISRKRQWKYVQASGSHPSATCAMPPTKQAQTEVGSKGASAIFDLFVVPTGDTEEEAALRHALESRGITESGLYFRCVHKASGQPQTNSSYVILVAGNDGKKTFVRIPDDAGDRGWMRVFRGDRLVTVASTYIRVPNTGVGAKRDAVPGVDLDGLKALPEDAIRRLLFADTEGKEDDEEEPSSMGPIPTGMKKEEESCFEETTDDLSYDDYSSDGETSAYW